MATNEVQAIIAEADLISDGKLDYGKFCCMLTDTSNQCVQANRQKWLQVVKTGHGSNQWSPLSGDTKKKNHEQRRQEIRMYLNPTYRKLLPARDHFKVPNPSKQDPTIVTKSDLQSNSNSNESPSVAGEVGIFQGPSHLPSGVCKEKNDGANVVFIEHHEQHGDHVEEMKSLYMARQTDHLLGSGQPLFLAEAHDKVTPLTKEVGGMEGSLDKEETLPTKDAKKGESLGRKMPHSTGGSIDDGKEVEAGAEGVAHGVLNSMITSPPRKPNNTEVSVG